MSSRAALAVPGDIATLTGGYIYDRRLLEGLRARGRDVALLELGTSFPDPTPRDAAEAAARLAALEEDRPVIVDGLVLGSIPPATLAGLRAPLVAMIHHPLAHEGDLDAARRAHLHRTERENLARAVHVVVPSPHTAALLVSDYAVAPERITVARPGTDRPWARRDRADPPLILSVGIQVRRKGHDVLLRALARIADRRWQAVIAGGRHDADHATELERLHRTLGLGDRVRLAGRVEREELEQLYARASIFALATRHEGYGIVFDEAMAHGLPIVSCRAGAVPETVAPGAGLLVPSDDPEAFAFALDRLLSESDLRADMAAAAARAGAGLGGWDIAVGLVSDVLDRAAPRLT